VTATTGKSSERGSVEEGGEEVEMERLAGRRQAKRVLNGIKERSSQTQLWDTPITGTLG